MPLLNLLTKIRDLFKDHEFSLLLTLVIITLTTGTIFYQRIEQWSYLNALYFSVITLTTVGYGDIYPVTDVGKIFTMIYLLVGIGIIFGFINYIAHHAKKQEMLNDLVKNPQIIAKRLLKGKEDIKTFKKKFIEGYKKFKNKHDHENNNHFLDSNESARSIKQQQDQRIHGSNEERIDHSK